MQLFRKLLAASDRLMQGIMRQDIEHSNSSKIITDANGNAMLNMNNQHVRDAMLARMEELAAKRSDKA